MKMLRIEQFLNYDAGKKTEPQGRPSPCRLRTRGLSERVGRHRMGE